MKKLKCDIERDIAPVDILINNAGIMPLLSIREGTEIEIERIVKVNITSHYIVLRISDNVFDLRVLMKYFFRW